MESNKSSHQQTPTSNQGQYVLYFKSGLWAKRPNPPTPEMVARAQPYRADTLQELEASIKNTRTAIVIDE